MAKYFNYFPKTYYRSDYNTITLDTVTNITSRFSFVGNSVKENSVTYYEYDIQEGDTPEIIASKLYGSPERHWIVLFMNDIIDPFYDWPMDQRTLVKFIDKKYESSANVGQTGLAWAKTTVHSYYKTETYTSPDDVTEYTIQVDSSTYANVAFETSTVTLQDGNTVTKEITKSSKTYYEYENDENEKKRTIKLLRPEFAASIEEEFRRVMSE